MYPLVFFLVYTWRGKVGRWRKKDNLKNFNGFVPVVSGLKNTKIWFLEFRLYACVTLYAYSYAGAPHWCLQIWADFSPSVGPSQAAVWWTRTSTAKNRGPQTHHLENGTNYIAATYTDSYMWHPHQNSGAPSTRPVKICQPSLKRKGSDRSSVYGKVRNCGDFIKSNFLHEKQTPRFSPFVSPQNFVCICSFCDVDILFIINILKLKSRDCSVGIATGYDPEFERRRF
jgi:hypothetical protein